MTDCPDGTVRDLLPQLVNDRLASDQRLRVDAHVRDCPHCQQELALLEALRTSLRRGPVLDVGAIVAAIPAYRSPRHSWGGWRAAAAIVLVAVGGTSVAVLQRRSVTRPDAASTSVARIPSSTLPVAPLNGTPRAPVIETPARELALANPAIDELDDRELSTLLVDLETIEAYPSADEEHSPDVLVPAPAGTY